MAYQKSKFLPKRLPYNMFRHLSIYFTDNSLSEPLIQNFNTDGWRQI